MTYADFARTFTRFLITRLFPPTWHQLTLHSGARSSISWPQAASACCAACAEAAVVANCNAYAAQQRKLQFVRRRY